MKRFLLIILTLSVIATSCLAQSVFIDFGVESLITSSPDDKSRHWNNAIWGGPGDLAPLELVGSKGTTKGIRMIKLRGFLGAFDTGENRQALYPATAGKDRWSLEQGKVDTGTIRFSGFRQGQRVTLELFGTRDAPVDFITRFAAGGIQTELNCRNNRNKRATLRDLKPDADGNIDLDVSIVSGPNGHLSTAVLRIQNSKSATADSNATRPKQEAVADSVIDSEEVKLRAELGLEDEGSNTVLMITGIALIALGLVIIIGSVWYFIKPESE
ncbi:MAG: hypothetical protein AAF649_02330 [Verrucomicrobiota bacterium]